jgi:predicted Zn finger-like uncharacterized protein
MRIHCPHCQAEIEVLNSVADSVVTCSSCKAVFDPRQKETLPGGEAPELLPGIRAGDGFGGYVLERRLGKGGMGQVFLATQLSLGRKVALKVLAPELLRDPEFVRRFDAEARVLAALNHPNIVQVIDKGIERGHSFLVMELVDGVSLRDLLSEKKLPPQDALRIVPQLCDALEYAHARGVVHRDIKPENILIGRDGTPKIADFGLARIVGAPDRERITRSNAVMGSLDYMAPEQRERTKDADHRADIYALGVVLYEMLTGELPLGRWDPPSKKVKLEVDIDEVVLRVLAKDPEMRYQRASEVGTEIRRRLAGERPPAGPEPPCETAIGRAADVLRVRRNEPAFAVACIALVFGAVFLTATFFASEGAQKGLGAVAGLLLGSAALGAIGSGVLPRMKRGTAGWLEFPLCFGTLMIAWWALPEPLDRMAGGALGAFVVALHLWKEHLVEPKREKDPSEKKRAKGKESEKEKDMRVTIEPAPGAPARTFEVDPKAQTVRETPASEASWEKRLEEKLRGAVERKVEAAVERKVEAAVEAPPAPAAPPRRAISAFAFLGFLAACLVFVVGALGASVLYYGHASDWAVLEDWAASAPRELAGFVVFAHSGEVVPGIMLVLTLAGIGTALVAAWNLAAFFATGRRSGKRGRGLAFVGLALVVGVGLAFVRQWHIYQLTIDQWRENLTAPEARAFAGVAPRDGLPQGYGRYGRADRVLAANALRWREGESATRLAAIAEKDESAAVRLAATAALGEKLFAIVRNGPPAADAAALAAAEGELAKTKGWVAKDEAQLERARELFKSGDYGPSSVRTAEQDLARAREQMQEAQTKRDALAKGRRETIEEALQARLQDPAPAVRDLARDALAGEAKGAWPFPLEREVGFGVRVRAGGGRVEVGPAGVHVDGPGGSVDIGPGGVKVGDFTPEAPLPPEAPAKPEAPKPAAAPTDLFFGVTVAQGPGSAQAPSAVVITGVWDGSPAAKAGLRVGERVESAGIPGALRPIYSVNQLAALVADLRQADAIELMVDDGTATFSVKVPLR